MADDKKIIFSMVGVSKMFPPHKQVLKDIYLSFFYGAKIGIIGLNGSGKSTLLKIIAGVEKSYQGEVVFSPGYSVGYLEQEPKLDPEKTVKEVVQEGVQPILDLLAEYEKVNESFGDPDVLEDPDKMEALIARQAELQDHIDASDAWNIDNKLERAMDALRCPPEDQLVKFLSGGERRRVALCRLLLQQPDILLLDEPTNHLDAESIDWLEQHLQQYPGTVIAITHDRYFLDHVAGWILELDRGEGIPWQGNYTSWLEQKTKRMEMEEKQASKRRKTLERELEWVRMAPKARQSKGKARLNSYDKLLNEDQKEREEKLEIFIPNGPRLGKKVIEAHGVAKAFGDKLLIASQWHRGCDRTEWSRKNYAVQTDYGTGGLRQRNFRSRRDREDRLCGPDPQRYRPCQDGLSSRFGRTRNVPHGWSGYERSCLPLPFQFYGSRSGETHRGAFRWRT